MEAIGHTDEEYVSMVKTGAWLAQTYKRDPRKDFIRHYDVTGKTCPGIIGWNEEIIYDVNTGKATGKDIIALIEYIKTKVKEQHGVELRLEQIIID